MKTLVIGDTHLSEFDENKCNFLENLLKSADRVIITGDFWDSWFTTFDDFLNSEWNRLFPILLSKEAVYIYGNHDPLDTMDDRVSMFCVRSSYFHDVEINGKRYHFEHGHRILKNVEEEKFMLKIYSKAIRKAPKAFLRSLKRGEGRLYSLFPKIKNDNSVGRRYNSILKNKLNREVMNIFGDTHVQELDLANNFANTGSIEYGHASYIVIDKDGLEMREERY